MSIDHTRRITRRTMLKGTAGATAAFTVPGFFVENSCAATETLPAGSPWLYLDSVTMTPHIAGVSITTARVAADMGAREVQRLLVSEPPIHAVACTNHRPLGHVR